MPRSRLDRTTRSARGSSPPLPSRRGTGRLLDVRAHPAQEVDDGTPGGVRAHIPERQLGIRVDRRRDEPERGTRRVGGHAVVDGGDPAGPSSAAACQPSSVVSVTATPRARSIRSVWSRVATASLTAVSPSAARPASRIADLTCALGTGVASEAARGAGGR